MAITYVGGAADSVASAASVTVTHGLTINENDVIVAVCHGNNVSSESWSATGFTRIYGESNPTADTSVYTILYRVCGGSEGASYTFDSNNTADRNQVIMWVWRGVDTATIWDVQPSDSTRNFSSVEGTSATCPSMTVTAGAAGMVFGLRDGAGTISSADNSYTNEVEPATPQQCVHGWSRIFASAGSSGVTTLTLSATDHWVAHQFAVKEDVGNVIDVPLAGPYW